jgi:7-cyano-7-deazaguanine synthase
LPTKTSKEVLILLSGGIDSTACLNFYLSRNVRAQCLIIDYGQPSVQSEFQAASRICTHYRVILQKVVCQGFAKKKDGMIQGRNGFLLYAALMEFRKSSGIIAIGVHAGTPYIDCSAEFIKSVQITFDDYTDGRIKIGAPFLEWTKRDIWMYCSQKRVPTQLTYSCEMGNKPCGLCLSCRDRKALHALPKHNN